jgi:CubicO group peptidase (beta-lactamase class C family)
MQIVIKKRVKIVFAGIAIVLLSACGGGSGGGIGGGGTGNTATQPTQPANLGAAIDSIMSSTMTSTGVTAATVTVMKNGQVLYEKGYGFQDAAANIPLPASAMMVTASTVKPFTAAAIQNLASNGKLALTDHVFCTGSNAPCWLPSNLLSSTSDPRAGDITIAELIAHQGGWNIALHGNVDFDKKESIVQSALGLAAPPAQSDDIRYWMAQPLDFTPGTQVAYTNFGYMLLGAIVTQASGTSYLQYVQSTMLAPLGIANTEFSGAASLLANRNPREPNYVTSLMGPDLFDPGTTVLVTNGAINAPNWVSATTAVTTTKTMATIAGNFFIKTDSNGTDQAGDGTPLAGATNDGFHFGNYPGTSALIRQLPSGTSYAVLMNKNNDGGAVPYESAVMISIDAAISASGD